MCKELIVEAHKAGCDYVKIQKREPDICVPEEQKNKMRETPWGTMTYLEYKKKIEFTEEQVVELIEYTNSLEKYDENNRLKFFASVWDKPSVDVMARHTELGKIPSALITDLELCRYAREKFKTLIISTGMSTEEEIEKCVEVCSPDVIMHTNSTYPCPVEDLNLRYITWLQDKYTKDGTPQIGYSGHEYGLVTTFGAVALGAKWVERHITLDRTLWGSDQQSSIEPKGLVKLVKGIRDLEKAMRFAPMKRVQCKKEDEKRQTLRGTTKKEEEEEETFKLQNLDEVLADLNKLQGTNMARDEEDETKKEEEEVEKEEKKGNVPNNCKAKLTYIDGKPEIIIKDKEEPYKPRTSMERMTQISIDRDFS